MDNIRQNKRKANQLLTIIWGTLTALLLFITVFIIWKSEQREIIYQAEETAENISHSIEKLISNFTKSISVLNINQNDITQCHLSLRPKFEKILINSPKISAISLFVKKNSSSALLSPSKFHEEDYQLLCSTLPDNVTPKISTIDDRSLTLSGPIKMNEIKLPVYILQQQFGEYYLNSYILQNELEKLIKPQFPYAKIIALYDKQRQEILLELQQDTYPGHGWHRVVPQQSKYDDVSIHAASNLLHYEKLINLDNVGIIIEIDKTQMKHMAFRYIFITIIIILLLSSFIFISLKRLVQHHYSLRRAIINAVQQNSFFPVYQPIMDRRANVCCGAEVLMRWQSTEHEVIMPDNFVGYTEKSGLIIPITLQLTKKVFADFSKILQEKPYFHLAINFSSIHFSDPKFFRNFMNLCNRYQIPFNQIILEVTERELLQHDASIASRMQELREVGFSIAVDDFGTGNSNLNYLQRFPFNYLKIDRIFVNSIGTGAVTESLNLSIIEMADRLGLKVIAEGVETYEQLETLEEHGAFLMQGWYFSKALTFDSFLQFLQRNS